MNGTGKMIREARTAAGLTIAEVAERSGFSSSYISQVERDLSNPSLSALGRIAGAVGLKMPSFFSEGGATSSPGEAEPDSTLIPTSVIRRDRRKTLIYPGSHLRYELLCPDVQHAMEIHTTIVPGGVHMEEPIAHPGEERAIVLRGRMELVVGSELHTLEAGDSIYFAGARPHLWRNAGEGEMEVIWIMTPPHF
jgi:transcriptional regulator with XRE-family HTH domain